MNLDELERRTKKEIRNIKKILPEDINKTKLQALMPIIENTAWMKVKLDDLREKIKNSGAVIPYDNGGGQKGVKENPAFRGYESLWKSYLSGMDRILGAMPEESAKEVKQEITENQTVLELVRNKHRKNA